MTSIAVGWGASALVFWILAEAHWQTVLWASLARAFLVLAVASGSVALFLMLWRSIPDVPSERVRYLLRRVPLAVIAAVMAWRTTLESPELYGLLVFVAAIGCLFALHPAAQPELQRLARPS